MKCSIKSKRMKKLITITGCISLLFAAFKPVPNTLPKSKFVTVTDGVFKDSLNRQIIFHGMNLVNKNKTLRYRGDETEADFINMSNWGFNCIRLGVNWSALEPACGKFDESYLAHLDQFVKWSKKYGIYVLLDMHQDLYGAKFDNGAPEWATIDKGLPYKKTENWNEGYNTPAVKTAFDNFWNDAPAPDGIGVQQHLVKAWQFVAKRYAKENAVIGYDLLNEPFIGSPIDSVWQIFLKVIGNIYEQKGKRLTPEEVYGKWTSTAGNKEVIDLLADTVLFKQTIDETEPIYARFEKEKLMPYYQRASDAIREVDTKHIIFTEPSVSANIGIYSHISALKGAKVKGQQAYAAHAYDLVTDTKFAGEASFDRLKFIYNRLGKKQKEMNLPLLVGEWGAFYGANKEVVGVAAYSASMQEQLNCGDIYWDYSANLSKRAFFPYINRAYPQCTAGELVYYKNDPVKGLFTMTWKEKAGEKQSTVIYLPKKEFKITSSVQEPIHELKPAGKDGPGILVLIKPSGKTTERTISIEF
jgi:endoglycosylceramidase